MQERTKSWDTGGADPGALHRALAGLPAYSDITPADLEPLRTKGLVHAHVRICGAGAVLRIPRLGSFGQAPAENLAYQAACFRRAGPSGHVPDIYAALPPGDGMPWGALVIAEIHGATPALPRDLPAIARALAAIHALDVPRETLRPPLPSHADPVAATVAVIETQAGFLDRAGLAPDAIRQIRDEIAWARSLAADAAGADHPVTLVGTDTHPGNFMVRQSDGEAVFVDMEKMLYGAPAIDLAHASVYTSTMWDADVATALSDGDVAAFYQAYFAAAGPGAAARIRPWCAPLRRLTWLRTTTWCAKWRVESQDGAAWAAASHDPAYLASVRARIADYFDPATIARIRAGFTDL